MISGIRCAFLLATCMGVAACESEQPLTDTGPPPDSTCSLGTADQDWLDRALDAWQFSRANIVQSDLEIEMDAVIFDANCLLIGKNAMSSGSSHAVEWRAAAHKGSIRLPNGEEMPAAVTSFTQATDSRAFFVMSTPSVWQDGGVSGGPLGLHTLMVAVLLHEAVHVSQFPTYGEKISELSERHSLPESFNDDSIQHRFDQTPEFVASIEAETDLLFESAFAPSDELTRDLATKARELMQQRRNRWFVDVDGYLSEAEDLWLTLEGSGQWVGLSWLTDPAGQDASIEDAQQGFGRRSRWWTQNQGLAMALIVNRLQPGWKTEVFRDGGRTLTQLMDDAIR